ncbi:MAG: dihydroneopterin aldolase [Burkholderiales bacterium]
MDVIFIREFRFDTLIGIYDWEKKVPQRIELNIEIGLANGKAAASNDIDDTIDYGRVISRIRETCKARHFPLLEALAEHLARLILDEFHAASVKLSVAKLALFPGVKQVGVTIERTGEQ